MTKIIKKFASPSKIIFTLDKDSTKSIFTLADAKRGDTFLFKDAICMLTEVSAFQALCIQPAMITERAMDKVQELLKAGIFITNLQTGHTFAGKGDEEIQWVKVTMTVESE